MIKNIVELFKAKRRMYRAKKARDACLALLDFKIEEAQSCHGKTRHLHKKKVKMTHEDLSYGVREASS